MATVDLRIVGIFFEAQIPIDPAGATVKEVLQNAQAATLPGVDFSFEPTTRVDGFESPKSFTATYEAPFSRPKVPHPGASFRQYSKGTYTLAESFDPSDPRPASGQYSVWQYYILRGPDKELQNFSQKFIPYDDSELAVVEAGDLLIWRLVTIRSESLEAVEEMEVAPAVPGSVGYAV